MGANLQIYEEAYAPSPERDAFAAWRALGARAKADHVEALCLAAGSRPRRIIELGCGDGALLAELAGRGFAREYAGFDVAVSAIESLQARDDLPGLVHAGVFDGESLPLREHSFDVALLSHVLEHVPDPGALLEEAARVAKVVVLEVPLEANLSAGRSAAEGARDEIGHIQRFDRSAVHALVASARLEIRAELSDPLDREVHLFHAETPAERARALAKAGVRRAAFRASRRLAERLFTVHYACVCVPATRRRAPGSPRGSS